MVTNSLCYNSPTLRLVAALPAPQGVHALLTLLDGGNHLTVLDDLPPQPARAPKRRGEVGPIDADLREFLSAGSENRQFVSQIGMRAYGRTPPAWQFVIQFASLRLMWNASCYA